MKTSLKGFISPLLLALIAVLLISGGVYVYVQQKQANESVSTEQESKDSITVQNIQGRVVTFKVVGNSEQTCTEHEYKVDFGDGDNTYLNIPEGTCKKVEAMFTYTYGDYPANETYNARLHDLTDITYYEPAFDQVENPVATVTVQIVR